MTHDFTIVLGERMVPPGAIVQLVFRARLVPIIEETTPALSPDLKIRDERHQVFWATKNDAEEIAHPAAVLAHTPCWPAVSAAKCC
jgi:translocation protein SEC63